MKFNKIMIALSVALPICVAVRILQIVFTIEYANGFYSTGKELSGNAALVFIALVGAVFAVLSFFGEKINAKVPKSNLLTTISSLIVAVALFGELFGENMPMTMPAMQVLILKTVTAFTAAYFVAFATTGFTEFKMPTILHAVPCFYAIAKTIFTFINISSLALISDNILLIASYCALMLFFINRAKLYNRLDKANIFTKIFATSAVCAIFCITLSLASIVINIVSSTPYLHTDTAVMRAVFSLGLFVIVFLCEVLNQKEHI